MEKPWLVISDAHLGAVPSQTERELRRFISTVPERAGGLLLAGDLFDFWFEYRSVIPRQYYRVVAALAEVTERGVPILFVGGNHDAWAGSFLRDEVGLELIAGPTVLELAGRRTLVVHGDGVGGGDLGYRLLKSVIRSRWAEWGFRQLHPDWGWRIARAVSSTEGREENPAGLAQRGDRLEGWAAEQLRADPALELVIAGHAHTPLVRELFPGRFYANAGDWIHHFSYLVIPAGREAPPVLKYWNAHSSSATDLTRA
ncbi:MAG: UDP-2,3-diacylglucosamine diphosphatase [Longimicrobiaceae bacterium]